MMCVCFWVGGKSQRLAALQLAHHAHGGVAFAGGGIECLDELVQLGLPGADLVSEFADLRFVERLGRCRRRARGGRCDAGVEPAS